METMSNLKSVTQRRGQAHLSPLSTWRVCQPYDWKRCSTFSVNATAVSPSMEMSANQSVWLRVGYAALGLTVVVVDLRCAFSETVRKRRGVQSHTAIRLPNCK